MDRAFIDFSRLYTIHQHLAYFITRAKTNTKCKRVYSAKVNKATGVMVDQAVRLVNFYLAKQYPEIILMIKYLDAETEKKFTFLTNNFELTALQIALLYKQRWKVELFFKWIKQHLKIKSFWGYSENAVKVQVYCAIITFVTVALFI